MKLQTRVTHLQAMEIKCYVLQRKVGKTVPGACEGARLEDVWGK
jgi:hypothetical protein